MDQPVAPPPESDETVVVAEETLTTASKASPTWEGSTDKVVTPLPALLARLPTAEMVGLGVPVPLAVTSTATVDVVAAGLTDPLGVAVDEVLGSKVITLPSAVVS